MHVQCVSQGRICRDSVIWQFSCQIIYFSSIFADFEQMIRASEISEHRRNWENTNSGK